jgi:competence protein ComEA
LVERILAERAQRGGFVSFGELRSVPGIGPARAERLKPWLPSATSAPIVPAVAVVDINSAGVTELQTLPGIGPKIAQRIVAERSRGRFRTVDDLRRVAGIGPKTLDKLRPFIRVQ